MTSTITLFYAGLLGVFMSALSIRVPMRRGALGVTWGDGNDDELATRIRAFGNFIEYVPAILVVMMVLEGAGASPAFLHGLGIALVAARGLHAYWLRRQSEELSLPAKIGRASGAMLTWLVLLTGSGYALALATGVVVPP
ncbi:MAG: MAPEG family protein [Myxococcota bacterium]